MRDAASARNPWKHNTRLSECKATRSVTVAMLANAVASMRKSRNSGLTFSALVSVCAVAQASLNATAAPQRSLKRDGQSGLRGLIIAQASVGRTSGGSW